ncbi:helix-turn-helix domain-containing protein [Agathobaculum sp.]|uniref:helix-turn-helix domain-containing protein n=1 Tax=Agathobaculum sp. TaxID=2048138 RepID=UPI003AB5EB2E
MKSGDFVEYSYRFRVYPTEEQKKRMTKPFDCSRKQTALQKLTRSKAGRVMPEPIHSRTPCKTSPVQAVVVELPDTSCVFCL